jgi:hypothetical protein
VATRKTASRSLLQLLIIANVFSSLIILTLMMEAMHSFETSVPTRATQCRITTADILQNELLLAELQD